MLFTLAQMKRKPAIREYGWTRKPTKPETEQHAIELAEYLEAVQAAVRVIRRKP